MLLVFRLKNLIMVWCWDADSLVSDAKRAERDRDASRQRSRSWIAQGVPRRWVFAQVEQTLQRAGYVEVEISANQPDRGDTAWAFRAKAPMMTVMLSRLMTIKDRPLWWPPSLLPRGVVPLRQVCAWKLRGELSLGLSPMHSVKDRQSLNRRKRRRVLPWPPLPKKMWWW